MLFLFHCTGEETEALRSVQLLIQVQQVDGIAKILLQGSLATHLKLPPWEDN